MMRFPAGRDPGAGTQVDRIASSPSFRPEGDHFSCCTHGSDRRSPMKGIGNAQYHGSCSGHQQHFSHDLPGDLREPTFSGVEMGVGGVAFV